MDIYTALAREAINDYLLKNKLPDFKKINPELLKIRKGCFVSLHLKENDALRGCIGTISPTYKHLAGEIVANSIAALSDPRFPKVTKEELDNLKISVDVLSNPEKIASTKELNPKKFGVIIHSTDGRTGVLLPDLEGVDTVEKQLKIVKNKAEIAPDEENLNLYRFSVHRYLE